MNLAEILIISIGLSFDIFAVTVCVGATLQKIEKKKLVCMGLIFCIWQLMAVGLGFLVARFPVMQARTSEMQNIWDGFSVIIFLALGVYMLIKGWRKKDFLERRISGQLEEVMDQRQTHVAKAGDARRLQPVESVDRYAAVVAPIVAAGDVTGAVCMMLPESGAIPGESDVKLCQVAAAFLGKQMEE